MDSERWRRIEQMYYRALAAPPDQRSTVLDESCAGDPDLRREVESLLAADNQAGEFLSPEHLQGEIADLGSGSALPGAGGRLGDYKILAVLGAGAMGEVYRARDTNLGREVALKILPPHLTHNAARVARFRSEARAASALNHPNAVTIYEIGQAGGIWFIAAELIEGNTLRERLRRGKLPVEEAIGIVLQCADALAAAHRAGIVHRDIKPENIMIRPDGVAKVVDFGLARMVEPRPEWGVEATQTGCVMGTPRYMSPEQARGQKTGARSDIFSLGAVLYEMIAGRPAFPGTTTAEVFASLLDSEPGPAGAGRLDEVISKALEKDCEARYQTMDDFAQELRIGQASRPVLQRLARGAAPVALLAVAGVAIYASLGLRDLRRDQPLDLVPLTAFSGPKTDLALSPDGSRVAFAWEAPGKPGRHIYIKPVGPGEPVQLTFSPSRDVLPSWSPDGSQIAFCRERSLDSPLGPHDIYIIPAGGGAEHKVAEGWRGVSWSPDGKTLALALVPNGAMPPARESGGIFLLSLNSGERRVLTASHRDGRPAFSPNGKWIAFRRVLSGTAWELFLVPAEGGPARQLTFDGQEIRGFTWTADSREIVFASSRNGAEGSLWRIGVTRGAPRSLSPTLRGAYDPSISQEGRRLVYREERLETSLYLLTSLHSGSAGHAVFSPPVSIVNSSREDHSPAFSPDGEHIAFVSNRSGNPEIWVAHRDGSQPVRLTSLRAKTTGTPRWSPDGTRIAFDSTASGNVGVYVIDSGGGIPRLISAEAFGSYMASWSPDGKWIYFTCGSSGAREIWKLPASGGAATQLTHTGAFEAHASPDGRLVYFSKQLPGAGRTIWSIAAAGGTEEPVPGLEKFRNIGRCWGVLEDGIYFVSYEQSPEQTVRFLNFRTRRVTPLFALPKQIAWGVGALALSRDGRYAVATELEHEVQDLMMIDNFR